jgi:hypothetical protein
MMVKVALEVKEETRWIAILIGSEPAALAVTNEPGSTGE